MSDLALLRQVIAYARANGWSHDSTQLDNGPREHRWMRNGVKVSVWGWGLYVNDREYWPASVRQAVDVIVALGVLPVEFSSAYAEAQGEIDGLGTEIANRDAELTELDAKNAALLRELVSRDKLLRAAFESGDDAFNVIARDESWNRWAR